jgi:hypothetical protein
MSAPGIKLWWPAQASTLAKSYFNSFLFAIWNLYIAVPLQVAPGSSTAWHMDHYRERKLQFM